MMFILRGENGQTFEASYEESVIEAALKNLNFTITYAPQRLGFRLFSPLQNILK